MNTDTPISMESFPCAHVAKPVDRAALTARLTYLAVELTDEALAGLVARAALLPKRSLTSANLNAAQVERYRRAEDEGRTINARREAAPESELWPSDRQGRP